MPSTRTTAKYRLSAALRIPSSFVDAHFPREFAKAGVVAEDRKAFENDKNVEKNELMCFCWKQLARSLHIMKMNEEKEPENAGSFRVECDVQPFAFATVRSLRFKNELPKKSLREDVLAICGAAWKEFQQCANWATFFRKKNTAFRNFPWALFAACVLLMEYLNTSVARQNLHVKSQAERIVNEVFKRLGLQCNQHTKPARDLYVEFMMVMHEERDMTKLTNEAKFVRTASCKALAVHRLDPLPEEFGVTRVEAIPRIRGRQDSTLSWHKPITQPTSVVNKVVPSTSRRPARNRNLPLEFDFLTKALRA